MNTIIFPIPVLPLTVETPTPTPTLPLAAVQATPASTPTPLSLKFLYRTKLNLGIHPDKSFKLFLKISAYSTVQPGYAQHYHSM